MSFCVVVVVVVVVFKLSVFFLFFLDFILAYEEIDDEPPSKETLRFRRKYMNNLQKSQLEFEEV